MSLSLVPVYCGGRRSGKTLSMTVEAVIRMIGGQNIWANYPIKFDFQDEDGHIEHYESKPITIEDLMMLQHGDIKHGAILLDEWNLWCNARRSMANVNLIFNGITQLIGKRDLSFYITTQNFQTLDKQIKWQCDLTVECFDLGFKYKSLGKGKVISQTITDWSGALTGRALWSWDDWDARMRNTVTRLLLHGKDFWHCYDSYMEYDVMKIMSTKYSFSQGRKMIEAPGDNDGYRSVYAEEKLNRMKSTLLEASPKGFQITPVQLRETLKEWGIGDDIRGWGARLKKAGFERIRSRKGDYYECKE